MIWNSANGDLRIATLRRLYAMNELSPSDIVHTVYNRIERRGVKDRAWIHVVPRANALQELATLERRREQGDALPLYGIPFAVKDNIDVVGLPTTAACPAFSYIGRASAASVARLLEAGAICIGKTNLDQFATGLNGTRSPYGACASVFNELYASGGSSSGSAVTVAADLVSFALGTDTGGSGRIPAGFNNIVGLKPTKGLISTRGLVPNCRTLDCVSVFAQTVEDAHLVLSLMMGFDANDPFSRAIPDAADIAMPNLGGADFRFGVLRSQDREYFGNSEAAALYTCAIERLEQLGGSPVEIDFAPFRDAGDLMFGGPWVAERLAGLRGFFDANAQALLPVIRDVIALAKRWSAVDFFEQLYRLEELRRQTESIWRGIDVLVVPTAATVYTIAELEADPIRLNNNLGHYSYFVNLLDLCAAAIPNGFLASSGVAMGITFIAPAWRDGYVAALGAAYHNALAITPGLSGAPSSLQGVA
jgi:allophanate hydrolase